MSDIFLVFDRSGWSVMRAAADKPTETIVASQPTIEDALRQASYALDKPVRVNLVTG